jgi:hypothetical protein
MTETPQQTTAVVERNVMLPGYSDFNTIRALASRMKIFSAFAGLSADQRWVLAQFSLSLGLNPFLGEAHYITADYAGGPEGPFVGIAGRIRKSQEQLKREGGNSATMRYEFRALTDEEKIMYLIPTGAVAQLCELRDDVTMNAYVENLKGVQFVFEAVCKMQPNADPIRIVEQIIGKRPVTVGIGYLTEFEAKGVNAKKSGEAKTRNHYPVVEKAQKRALNAALKKRFHIELPGFDLSDLPAHVATVLDGNLTLSPTGQWTVEVPEQPKQVEKEKGDDPKEGDQPSAEEQAKAEAHANQIIDLMEAGGVLKCARTQPVTCNHVIELHGISGTCEVPGCGCDGFVDPAPQQPVTEEKFKANRAALRGDDEGLV